MRPGTSFVPRRTTRLIPGDESGEIDVLVIARALTAHKKDILGIQARFGGKAFDVTWLSAESAARAATAGLEIGCRHFDLRLLGRRSLDVSVFVACEFPDEFLIELLKQYGTFDASKIRHLTLKEPGFQHIENGIRVIQFTELTRDLPSTLVYRNTPMGFRYTGQPKVCFKCASPDHMVRDCPRKNLTEPEHTTETPAQQDESDSESDTNYATDRVQTSEGESVHETESEMEQDNTPPPAQKERKKRHKRPHPITSDTDNSECPTKVIIPTESTETTPDPSPPTNYTPELFTAPAESATSELPTSIPAPVPPPQPFIPKTGPRFRKFIDALKMPGTARQQLMLQLKPQELYYKARGLWLQWQYGDYSSELTKTKKLNNKNDTTAWKKLKGTIKQDAYADLLRYYTDLLERFDLFPTK